MKSSSLVLLMSTLAVGCGLPFGESDPPPSNACEADIDCGDAATCVATAAGTNMCITHESELANVILEVQSTNGSGPSYVFFDALDYTGRETTGQVRSFNLQLPASVPFTGRMLAPDTEAACTAADGSVPVKVTFHRKNELAVFNYNLNAEGVITGDAETSTAAFQTSVPPGTYDIYMEPPPRSETCATPPPRLVTGVTVLEDTPVDFVPESAQPIVLTTTITVPATNSLEGWILEVVDGTYGHVVSDSLVLGVARDQKIVVGPEELRFYSASRPMVRLRNPANDLAVYYELSALDLDGDNDFAIDVADLVATAMPVQAGIEDLDENRVPSASVVLQSQTLTGGANQNATFRVVATADELGYIDVSLIPGTYVVTIIPQTAGVAPLVSTWTITPDGGGSPGRFVLGKQTKVDGAVSDPTGAPLSLVPLVVRPARVAPRDFGDQIFIRPDPEKVETWPARTQSGTTTAFGEFELLVDPGELDLFVQMPPETGFPWAVLPSFRVEARDNQSVPDLGLHYPALAQGQVSGDMGLLPYAVVRAWVQPTEGGPLIQIGAATTNEQGIFVLPLPPDITLESPSDSTELPE